MNDERNDSDRLIDLRRRWDEDPSAQVALQLAEEYRALDRQDEGLRVLDEAVERYPRHLASRVARGRYLLEVGRHEDAARVLEEVVEKDPTHLIANKLLVRLYLETGRVKQARDRLDLYSLLNEGDPEIEGLAASVERVEEGEPPASASPPVSPFPSEAIWAGLGDAAYWRSFAAEGVFQLPDTVGTLAPAGLAVAAVAHGAAAAVAPAVSPPAPPVEAVPAAMPTATLAGLYLRQGHLDEAEQAFQQILGRDPGSEEARSGLAEVELRRGTREAGGDQPESTGQEAPEDLRGRKVRVLQDYLGRLRGGNGKG